MRWLCIHNSSPLFLKPKWTADKKYQRESIAKTKWYSEGQAPKSKVDEFECLLRFSLKLRAFQSLNFFPQLQKEECYSFHSFWQCTSNIDHYMTCVSVVIVPLPGVRTTILYCSVIDTKIVRFSRLQAETHIEIDGW